MTHPHIIVVGAALALLASLFVITALLHRRKASPKNFVFVGSLASVEKELRPEGAVLVRGELWRARARGGNVIARGRLNVRVVGARGHLLEVESIDEAKLSDAAQEVVTD